MLVKCGGKAQGRGKDVEVRVSLQWQLSARLAAAAASGDMGLDVGLDWLELVRETLIFVIEYIPTHLAQ